MGSWNLTTLLDSADKPTNVEVKYFFMRSPCKRYTLSLATNMKPSKVKSINNTFKRFIDNGLCFLALGWPSENLSIKHCVS